MIFNLLWIQEFLPFNKHIPTFCLYCLSSVEYYLCAFLDFIAHTSVLSSFHNSLIHHLQLLMVLLVYLQVIDEQTVCPLQVPVTWWSYYVFIWLFYDHCYINSSKTKLWLWEAISLKKFSLYVDSSACLFFPFCGLFEPGLPSTNKLLYLPFFLGNLFACIIIIMIIMIIIIISWRMT